MERAIPNPKEYFQKLEKAQESLKTGTTTIGIKCADGVVLVTDKRATMGNLIASKTAQKLYRLADYVGATIAGGVADAQAIMDIIKAEINLFYFREGRRMPVKSVTTIISSMLFGARYYPYMVQLIVGGFDTTSHLYTLDLLGSRVESETIVATGSGSPVAYGVLEDAYHPDLTVKEALPIGLRAVYAAIQRDAASGNGFHLGGITNEGFTLYTDAEIDKMLKTLKK